MEGIKFEIGSVNGIGTAFIQGMVENEEFEILASVVRMVRERRKLRVAAERERLALADEYGPPNELLS